MLPDDLERCALGLKKRGREARIVERTGSTNDDARMWAKEGAPAGAVVIADAQEHGRGRQGRSWSTPPGQTLAMSIVLRPHVAPNALPPIALVAGLAARTAIGARVSAVMLKWPNDVVVRGKKIAGILVEGSIAGTRVESVVVGIGVNVARTSFPEGLNATSIALEGGDVDRGTLALDVLDDLDRELAAWLASPDSIGARLQPHDCLRGHAVLMEGGAEGVADGIADDGRLRVRVGDSLVLAQAGEVSLR
jgi:BirA family transcriptional regulator, biotin operon repressor / biotin---[acetyl-CoA-carboxylase] ligase